MPRLGVTYSDVARTATKLVEQNIHPTIEEVRKLLCTGSNSTINRHLRQWRDTQGNAMEAEKGLPETLLIAVKGIYAAIQEEAAHKISAIETEAKEKLNQCDVQLNQLTHQHTILFQTNRALENKINAYQLHEIASQKMIDTLNQTIDKKISENQLLQERIDDKKSEIKRITDQLKHAQHNLDHYREAIKQERDAEKQRYELQISTLEQQVHQYQANLSTAQNKMAALIQKTESVENEKNKIEFNLQKIVEICHKDKLSLQRYEINYIALNKENDKIKLEYHTLFDESHLNKNKMNEMIINIEKLTERLSIMDFNLKKAEDKIELLSNKNLFLLQEKTELISQFKKMQTREHVI